jgi:hypothetical protein
LNPALFKWKERANSRPAALKKPYLDLDDRAVMKQLLLKGRNRTDVGHHVIEDLGFRVGLWNGTTDNTLSASISLLNGSYCKGIFNVLYLDFPGFDDLERNDDLARALIDAARGVLDPDWVMLSRDIDDPRDRPYLDRGMFPSTTMPFHRRALHAIQERHARRGRVSGGVLYLRSIAPD